MNTTLAGVILRHASALVLALASLTAAEQPAVRAVLLSAKERKPAPHFKLPDASGTPVTLKSFRGKVVLLNFWATWCGGCKQEIPWFADFQRTYGGKHFAVVGVSLDEGGWSVVRPFLATTAASYQMLLGNDPVSEHYGIKSMPATFLIDRKGKVAAAYTGLVDKNDIEANIKALLSKH